jgi:hypothetical protein
LALAKACALREVLAPFAVSVRYEVIRRYDQRLNDEKAFGIEEMAYSRLINGSATVSRPVKRGVVQHWRCLERWQKRHFDTRSSLVSSGVRGALYPFNETQRVTMINRRAVSHPRQA